MSGIKILYRQIYEVPAENWAELLQLEAELDAAEAKRGYPPSRKLRPFFGTEHSETVRVAQRIFDSYADFGKKIEERQRDRELAVLDDKKRALSKWQREETFYVDSGMPVPRWMQAVSRKPFTADALKCAADINDSTAECVEKTRRNIETGKLRVLYRHIQMVPKDRWAEKFEQERLSDEAELKAGNPLPLRYRSFWSPERSHTRVSEREYESFAEMCILTEAFLQETSPEDSACMEQEARRQAFFTWEHEELYIVD